ncbi:MAG: hypothetical protein ACLFR1_09945 [Spirochaetia bacterium]
MHKYLISLLLIAVLAGTGAAENKSAFRTFTAGEGRYIYGYTEYRISGKVNESDSLLWGSRLRFPVDGVYAGGSLDFLFNTALPFRLFAQVYTNVINPVSSMEDEDWYQDEYGNRLGFSYSHSGSSSRLIWIDAGIGLDIIEISGFSHTLQAGINLAFLRQDVIGGEALQYTQEGGIRKVTLPNETVLDYEIDYYIPYIGYRFVAQPITKVSLSLELCALASFSRDLDDHVLRNKTAVGTAFGGGASADLGFRYRFIEDARFTPVFSVSGSILWLYETGTQRQDWYGDDPASDTDDTGSSVSDIPYSNTLFLLSGSGFLGFEYRY